MATDAFAVDAAVIAALRADGALMSLCPGGVWYGTARPGTTAVVIVDRFDHVVDNNLFDAPAAETFTYMVKAVLPDTSDERQAGEAAARIRAVLAENVVLMANGYVQQAPMVEVQGLRYPEVDPTNPDRIVQHAGGQYEVHVQQID